MPCLSIIVPHFGDTGLLENTLATVLQNRPADCEILLVHPGTYDDPYELAGEIRFVEAGAQDSPTDGLILALRAAQGEYVHLIRPGVEVDESWTDAAIACFDDPQIAAVCPLILRREKPQVIAGAGVRLNWLGQRRIVGEGAKNRYSKVAKLNPVGPSLTAAFYRRNSLERIGWLASDVGPDLADIDAALSLKQAGYKCCFEPAATLWLVEKEEASHWPPFASARGSERMIWRHAPILAGRRTITGRLLIVSAMLAFGTVCPKLLKRSLGRIAAWFEIAGHRRRWRQLDAVLDENLRTDAELRAVQKLPLVKQDDVGDGDATPVPVHQLRRAS